MSRELGLISDTHGLLRPEAVEALAGVEAILHAGDVGAGARGGGEAIVRALGRIAPVVAVRGNVDRDPWGRALPETAELPFGDLWIHARHIREEIDLDPRAAGFDVVVCGHSHRPAVETLRGVLWVNPGSAGPRRFRLPVTLARLGIDADGRPAARIVDLLPEEGA